MKTYGLRDIIGPVMVGPSSSHTAGALSIALMARRLWAKQPTQVHFTLYGSFAHTGKGHGTDKALAAGILGMSADDLDIRNALKIAKEEGVELDFNFDHKTETPHPNTVDILIESPEGGRLSLRGESIGGGAAVITSIDGVEVNITGEHTNVVVRQKDEPGVLAHISRCLSENDINIATANVYRTGRHNDAYTILETDNEVSSAVAHRIRSHRDVMGVRIIPMEVSGETDRSLKIPENAEEEFRRWDFTTGEELIKICRWERCSIAKVMRRREEAYCARFGANAGIDAYLRYCLDVMREAATKPRTKDTPSVGGLLCKEARLVHEATRNGAALLDPLAASAATYALAVLETNASMGRIVATPTAGSAGVLPAVLLALQDHRDFTDKQLIEGMLVAGAVGSIIARNASVSGAEGGCQAEVGSAAAMAAAAAVAMAGGTPEQSLSASANVLMSFMGLVCDPVGGLVEVPCQKRNATAANVALVGAQIALSGCTNLISFDEAVGVMDEVGRVLPFELRESALGGIASAPSACLYCNANLTC